MDISDFEAYAALKGDETLRVRPDRTALLVVDMQRYFVEPEFPFGQVLAKFQPDAAAAYFDRVKTTVVPNVQELLKPILNSLEGVRVRKPLCRNNPTAAAADL